MIQKLSNDEMVSHFLGVDFDCPDKEMVTGKLPFQAQQEAAYLYAIIHEAPARRGKSSRSVLLTALRNVMGERFKTL